MTAEMTPLVRGNDVTLDLNCSAAAKIFSKLHSYMSYIVHLEI